MVWHLELYTTIKCKIRGIVNRAFWSITPGEEPGFDNRNELVLSKSNIWQFCSCSTANSVALSSFEMVLVFSVRGTEARGDRTPENVDGSNMQKSPEIGLSCTVILQQ